MKTRLVETRLAEIAGKVAAVSTLDPQPCTKVYEPEIQARLGTAAHFCEVVLKLAFPGLTAIGQ